MFAEGDGDPPQSSNSPGITRPQKSTSRRVFTSMAGSNIVRVGLGGDVELSMQRDPSSVSANPRPDPKLIYA